MKKFTSLLLVFVLLCGLLVFSVGAEEKTQLRFKEDGTFTILQLSDPQDDKNISKELIAFIEKAIEETQPDLIVITGDIVEDSRPVIDVNGDDKPLLEGVKNKDYATALADTKATVEQIFAPIEESGIPYAVTQGNNDYNSGVTNEDWLAIYAQFSNCLTIDESTDAEGKIDQYLPILSSDSDAPAFGLWMLDNGKDFTEGQMQWMQEYNTNGVPGIVFEHVPTDDIGNLFEECKPWDDGAFADGTTAYRLNKSIATGHAEFAHEPDVKTEEFAVWQEQNVIGAFFGHEHTCGYTGDVDGITMGMTYGCQFAKFGPYGIRTLTLQEATGTFTTELYTYENGVFTLQEDDGAYETYDKSIGAFFAKIANVFKYILRSVLYLIKI
ncbi:MAG: metallophosphoesterase [Clostridia bacterium]|nr:metallophosphoesterase [Clostridia bacterium]